MEHVGSPSGTEAPVRTQQAARDKALKERTHELRQWRRWRRERVEALLQGPYAKSVHVLLAFFRTMAGPKALLDFIRSGPWCDADADVRFEILALVNATIIKRRESMGLVPFDDALPGQPDNVFLILRELLAPNEIHDSRREAVTPPGAEPGSIDSTATIQENAS
jgi:hypothetical protein